MKKYEKPECKVMQFELSEKIATNLNKWLTQQTLSDAGITVTYLTAS